MQWRDFQMGFLPDGQAGPFRLEHFHIPDEVNLFDIQGRPTGYGDFVRLMERGPDGQEHVWMSDTRAEITDHYPFLRTVETGSEPLITGLGIGMAVAGSIRLGASRVTVVEWDSNVIALVGPALEEFAADHDAVVDIHHANADEWEPPAGARYTSAWHDIWPEITDENLPHMRALRDRYAPVVDGPQFAWAEHECMLMGSVLYKMQVGQSLTDEEWQFAYRTKVKMDLLDGSAS